MIFGSPVCAAHRRAQRFSHDLADLLLDDLRRLLDRLGRQTAPHNMAASRHPSPTARIPTVTAESARSSSIEDTAVTTTHSQLTAEPDNAPEPTALTDAEVYATIRSLGEVGPAWAQTVCMRSDLVSELGLDQSAHVDEGASEGQ